VGSRAEINNDEERIQTDTQGEFRTRDSSIRSKTVFASNSMELNKVVNTVNLLYMNMSSSQWPKSSALARTQFLHCHPKTIFTGGWSSVSSAACSIIVALQLGACVRRLFIGPRRGASAARCKPTAVVSSRRDVYRRVK